MRDRIFPSPLFSPATVFVFACLLIASVGCDHDGNRSAVADADEEALAQYRAIAEDQQATIDQTEEQ